MVLENLCLNILKAESEEEVQNIIEFSSEMSASCNWKPLGGHENNFNTTYSQASNGDKALTELMTNMVDAVLMKRCHQLGIDPKGKEAPRTMYEAVEKFFDEDLKIHGGKLLSLADISPGKSHPWLVDFAKNNLVVGVTGSCRKSDGFPCYTFADNGEGQEVNRFEDTFLSFNTDNQDIIHKDSVPFVQGTFHMGSSGVFPFGGERRFKLIISRRYNKEDSEWGWTLIRRRPLDEEKRPVAEYFVFNGNVPSFYKDRLYPFHTSQGEIYQSVSFKTGTIIKLFNYETGTFPAASRRGIDRIFYEHLMETILPFRLFNFREKRIGGQGSDREKGVDARPFYGLEFFLLEKHAERGIIWVESIEKPNIGEIKISAIHLNEDVAEWVKASNHRIFHTVNGQVHYKKTKGYLTTCGLPSLKDRVVIFVDASNLFPTVHNDIWKGDREHIFEKAIGNEYLELVKTAIKNSKPLKELQAKIAQEELKSAMMTGGNDVFQKLIDSDATFSYLLSQHDPSVSLRNLGGDYFDIGANVNEWNGGKPSPSFIRFEKKKRNFDISLSKGYPVKALTDAENGYLSRAKLKGEVLIESDVKSCFQIGTSLKDGCLMVSLKPLKEMVAVGQKFVTKIGLKDEGMPEPVETEEITLIITDVAEKPKKENDDKRKKTEPSPVCQRGLPVFKLLTKDGRQIEGYKCEKWPEDEDFDEYDGGRVKDLGDEQRIYEINYDNAYLIKFRENKKMVEKKIIDEKYIFGMRILMFGFEHAFEKLHPKESSPDGDVNDFSDLFRRMVARGAASTVLTIVESLPDAFGNAKSVDDEEE